MHSEKVVDYLITKQPELPILVNIKLKQIKKSRFYLSNLIDDIENAKKKKGHRIVLIHGLRGTGKTTLLYQIYDKYKTNRTYLSGDDMFINKMDITDIIQGIDYINKKKIGFDRPYILLLDEITYIDKWDLKLKMLIDTRPNLIIIATSSSSLGLEESELTRRAKDLPVYPLSFREFLSIKYDINIPDSLSSRIHKKILKWHSLEKEYIQVMSMFKNYDMFALFNEYIRNDLPFSLELSNENEYEESIKRMIKRIVYEDLSKFANVESPILTKAEQMIYFISTIPSDGVKIETISQTIGISKETVVKLLGMFEKAMLIKSVQYSGRKRRFKRPLKWFFYSPSIRIMLSKSLGRHSDMVGNAREDAVFLVLSKYEKDIFYSHIADFIIGDIGFEVGGNKNERKDKELKIYTLTMNSTISNNNIPLPLFAVSV